MSNLPESDHELINVTRDEFENCRGKKDYPDAAFRYGWALVHSRRREDIQLGKHLLEELLARNRRLQNESGVPSSSSISLGAVQASTASVGPTERELLYTIACAYFRLKDFVEARTVLKDLLSKFPESSQARTLMSETEEAIIKDGLVTAGVATGVLVVGGIILGAVFGGSRKH